MCTHTVDIGIKLSDIGAVSRIKFFHYEKVYTIGTDTKSVAMQFIFGRELDVGELYDRENEINAILNSYRTRQPLGIVGFRRVGKSSILNNVKYLLEKDNVLVLKFSIEGISSLNEYSNRLIYSMLKELSKKYKLKYYKEEIKRTINKFLGSISQINLKLPDFEITLNKYNDYLENRIKASEIMENLIDLPEKLAENLGQKIVVIMDEFQYIRMLKEPFPEILRLMRSKFNEHVNVQYIISGSEIGIINELLNNKDQPFYAFFRIIDILPFDKDQSINFLEQGIESYNKKCDRKILEKIYDITSGMPGWLNLAGLDLVEHNCDIGYFLNDQTYKNIVSYELNRLTKNEIYLLKELSINKKMSEIKVSNKYRVIRSLMNRGLLMKDKNEFVVPDGLIRYYLRNL